MAADAHSTLAMPAEPMIPFVGLSNGLAARVAGHARRPGQKVWLRALHFHPHPGRNSMA
jgi:hypothetical protein